MFFDRIRNANRLKKKLHQCLEFGICLAFKTLMFNFLDIMIFIDLKLITRVMVLKNLKIEDFELKYFE